MDSHLERRGCWELCNEHTYIHTDMVHTSFLQRKSSLLLHDWLEEKKNDGAPMESSPNSICGTTFIFCKLLMFIGKKPISWKVGCPCTHLGANGYKKTLEPTPAGADRNGLTVLKVGSMEHYVQSTSSELQAMCGNWNLLGLTMPSLSEL